ncbi:MAG: hypothetical protein LQ338_003586 [Usnochroma carphineum]|nr:MAG: hypothetical protein LQ338_003586 [Usnochroma carphineum]
MPQHTSAARISTMTGPSAQPASVITPALLVPTSLFAPDSLGQALPSAPRLNGGYDPSLRDKPQPEASILSSRLPSGSAIQGPVLKSQESSAFSGLQSHGEPSAANHRAGNDVVLAWPASAAPPESATAGHNDGDTISEPNGPKTLKGTPPLDAGPDYTTDPQILTPSPTMHYSDTKSAAVVTAIHQVTSLLFPPASVLQLITIAGKQVTRDSASQYIIGTQTVTAGAPGITIDGTLVSLDSSATAVVVGASTRPLVLPQLQGVVTVDGIVFTRGPSSDLVIGTQTITPGAPAIRISGTPVSLAVGGTALIVAPSTLPLAETPIQGIFTADGFSFTRGPGSDFIIGTQTITPGSPAVSIFGTPVSLAFVGTAVVIGDSTIQVPGPESTLATLEINGNFLTKAPGSGLMIGSQTLIPGAPAVTVSGTPISLAADGTAVMIGDTTFPASDLSTKPVVLDINGNPFTEISGSDFMIGSHTLVAGGPAITVDGTLVSLGAAATDLVLGTQTEALTSSQGLGGIILAGFSCGGPGAPKVTNTSSVAAFASGSLQRNEQHYGRIIIGVALTSATAYLI